KQIFYLLNYAILLTLILTLNVTAKSYSQGEKIDLAVEDVKLKAVFPILEERGKIRLMYSEEGSALEQLVTLEVQDTPVLTVLDMLLANTNLEYRELDNNLVVVRRKSLQNNVRGVVRGSNGQPLSGVSVTVKGTSNGTATNDNGQFELTAVPANAVLVFSYVGFHSQEIAVNSRSEISVVLLEDARELGEVIVTALGIQRQDRELGYSASSVDTDQLTESRTTNVGNSLVGKVAGLNVSAAPTGPGGSSKIRLRGQSSFGGNNSPLIVV